VSEPFSLFARIVQSLLNKERREEQMKTIYKILRIKQVIKEVEGDEKFIIRSPEDAAKIAG
jgi:hypothetical protein